jgi:phage baseplate assembly protein W
MTTNTTSLGFPFAVESHGGIQAYGGDEAIRGKILQVLFTRPGERANLPSFGCGLFDLVFEPNNPILETAMEFIVVEALIRWLDNDIMVENVKITSEVEKIMLEIFYLNKQDQSPKTVQIQF